MLVLTGSILALTVNLNWVCLCGFAGLGLTFAGLTDLCPMAVVLQGMPWNRASQCRVAGPSAEQSGACP